MKKTQTTSLMWKSKTLLKIAISLFLVWHIFVMLIMPNLESYIGRATYNWVTPYAAEVGLNAGWNFFSPDPAHTMYFKIRMNKTPVEGQEDNFDEFYSPAERNQYVAGINNRRKLYAMRYMTLDPRRVEAILIPYLCRSNANTESIHIEHVVEAIPFLDEAVLNRSQEDSESNRTPVQFLNQTFYCSSANEISL